jgi:aspartate racemase
VSILGIVGGIAPGSTVEYYRLIVERYRARRGDGSYPHLLVDSIDLRHFLDLVGAGDRAPLVEHLVEEVERLARAGAGVALFASNTPHLVFDEVKRRSPLPLISIVEAAAEAAAARGYRRVGLLGTRFTMEGGFYAPAFGHHGITVVTPDPGDRGYVHARYFDELVQNVFREETRQGMIAVMHRLRDEEGIEAVVLGGTELPPLFRQAPPVDLPLLDTTAIHVEAAVDRLLSPRR